MCSIKQNLPKIILLIVLSLSFNSYDAFAQSNTNTNQANTNQVKTPEGEILNYRINELSQTERVVLQRLSQQEKELAELKAKFDTAATGIVIGAAIFTLIFSLGTGFSIYGFIRSEKRATEAHDFAVLNARKTEERAAQIFDLAITSEKTLQHRSAQAFELGFTGEKASQQRAAQVHEEFLTGSKETLELVNATLTLAKEASERAAKIIETKARSTIAELDQESQALLASVPSQDDRALIANPGSRSDLRSLAHKITGFEINRFILPEDIQLTPPCLFIKGMDFHLSQQYKDAISNWRAVALAPDTQPNLRSLAWYWIGYEQNNLNHFDEAEQSFGNALTHATGIRKYELQRIYLETRFFNKKRYSAQSVIQPLENLLNAISAEEASEERDARRTKIIISLGNVFNQTGNELIKTDRIEDAKEPYARAKELYEQVAQRDKWALFGYAEMLYALGEHEKAQQIFKDRVRGEAIDESVRREEPRTKVLARTTELICCLRVPDLRDEAPGIRSLVLQDLGRVDERLTVYSQVQKRNVTKSEFQDDLDELMSS